MKRAACLAAFACALSSAAGSAFAQEAGSTGGSTTVAPVSETSERRVRAAGPRLQRAYQRWRGKLARYDVWRGRDLVIAARSEGRPPSAPELQESIDRMRQRFQHFLRSPEGRAARFAAKVRTIPAWGRGHLRSIAWCESRNNPHAIGGGGAFRGLYQFTFGTWRVVGGLGDPAAAPRSEQTWRAWLLLSRHGSRHWPVCG
jgi:transglycosylase-like protein